MAPSLGPLIFPDGNCCYCLVRDNAVSKLALCFCKTRIMTTPDGIAKFRQHQSRQVELGCCAHFQMYPRAPSSCPAFGGNGVFFLPFPARRASWSSMAVIFKLDRACFYSELGYENDYVQCARLILYKSSSMEKLSLLLLYFSFAVHKPLVFPLVLEDDIVRASNSCLLY